MWRFALLTGALALPSMLAAQQQAVEVLPPQLNGSRPLEDQTKTAVVRDYVASWTTLGAALSQNQASALATDFVGTALSRLGETIGQQQAAGIRTTYKNLSHRITFIFYSPAGSSIDLLDDVSYDEEIHAGDAMIATRPVTARYLVVMTPSQVRWQVRILQAAGAQDNAGNP